LRRRRNSILLDANVLVAFIDQRDAHHGRAKDALLSLSENKELSVLIPVLGEAYSVIARRCRERGYDCKKAFQAMKYMDAMLIKENPSQNYHPRVVDSILDFPDLNYNDWLIILYALDNGIEVLSFDEKLNQKMRELSGRL